MQVEPRMARWQKYPRPPANEFDVPVISKEVLLFGLHRPSRVFPKAIWAEVHLRTNLLSVLRAQMAITVAPFPWRPTVALKLWERSADHTDGRLRPARADEPSKDGSAMPRH